MPATSYPKAIGGVCYGTTNGTQLAFRDND